MIMDYPQTNAHVECFFFAPSSMEKHYSDCLLLAKDTNENRISNSTEQHFIRKLVAEWR
jgi:hypothetical protein